MAEKKPFVFQGHPHYMAGMALGESPEVRRLVSGNGLVSACSDLLAQASDKSTHRLNRLQLLDAAKERARAARLASECCESMVSDVESNIDAPAPADLTDTPRVGTPGLYRNPPVAGNAVVSHDDIPAGPAPPPSPADPPPGAAGVANIHPDRDSEATPSRKRR